MSGTQKALLWLSGMAMTWYAYMATINSINTLESSVLCAVLFVTLLDFLWRND